MKQVDIAEAIQNMVQEKIYGEWKHEGFLDGLYTNGVRCNIDGKDYMIEVREVTE